MNGKFDRKWAKQSARAALAGARPHGMLVTLVYLLLFQGVALAAVWLTLAPVWERPVWTVGEAASLCALLLVVAFYLAVTRMGYVFYTMRLARGEECGLWCLLEGYARAGRVIAACVTLALRMLPWLLLGAAALAAGLTADYFLGEAGWPALAAGYAVWALLLLWLALRYALVPYLLLDCPDRGCNWVVSRSIWAMRGKKWTFLKFQLSFLGWWLLSGLTAGILGLWLAPYLGAATVRFYEYSGADEETRMPLTF